MAEKPMSTTHTIEAELKVMFGIHGVAYPTVDIEFYYVKGAPDKMPTQEVCEQIAKLNKYRNSECWAKAEKISDIDTPGNIGNSTSSPEHILDVNPSRP